MSRALLFVLAFLSQATLAANSRSIVDVPEVARAVAAGAILWDIRRAEDYDKGHLPGAVNINHVAQALLDEKSQLFLPTLEIERRLGNVGIDPRKPIIVYGARGSSYAHFALFALEYFGAKNARVFHGGVDGWREARRPLSIKGFARNPVKLKLAPRPRLAIDTDEVIARLDHPGSQFLDEGDHVDGRDGAQARRRVARPLRRARSDQGHRRLLPHRHPRFPHRKRAFAAGFSRREDLARLVVRLRQQDRRARREVAQVAGLPAAALRSRVPEGKRGS
jgi:3-mercaptopyruvate sulfurtransferase SseA